MLQSLKAHAEVFLEDFDDLRIRHLQLLLFQDVVGNLRSFPDRFLLSQSLSDGRIDCLSLLFSFLLSSPGLFDFLRSLGYISDQSRDKTDCDPESFCFFDVRELHLLQVVYNVLLFVRSQLVLLELLSELQSYSILQGMLNLEIVLLPSESRIVPVEIFRRLLRFFQLCFVCTTLLTGNVSCLSVAYAYRQSVIQG